MDDYMQVISKVLILLAMMAPPCETYLAAGVWPNDRKMQDV